MMNAAGFASPDGWRLFTSGFLLTTVRPRYRDVLSTASFMGHSGHASLAKRNSQNRGLQVRFLPGLLHDSRLL